MFISIIKVFFLLEKEKQNITVSIHHEELY